MTDNWDAYSKLVLKSIDTAEQAYKELDARIRELEKQIAVLTTKIAIWSTILGGSSAIIVNYLKKVI